MPVTVNLTPQTQEQWENVISEYKALTDGKRMWFQTIVPGFSDAFFIVAQPPTTIPFPAMNQNELLTVEMTLTIEDYPRDDNALVVPQDDYPDEATISGGSGNP